MASTHSYPWNPCCHRFVRDRLEVSPKIAGDELEALARASAGVARAIGEREIVNVIVRAPRLVNIATRG